MLRVLAISLLLLSPAVAMAQEYEPQPYDPNAQADTAADGQDQGVGTNGDATNTYGVPNADDQDFCCGMTSTNREQQMLLAQEVVLTGSSRVNGSRGCVRQRIEIRLAAYLRFAGSLMTSHIRPAAVAISRPHPSVLDWTARVADAHAPDVDVFEPTHPFAATVH